jgi:outer membrane protein TolC
MPFPLFPRSSITACIILLALSGCTTFSVDGGFDKVADATKAALKLEVRWPRSSDERAKIRTQTAVLLAHPLDVEDAVQVALLNNHELQASFEELGVSEADLVQSGRLPNPRFTLRHANAAGLYDIEETLTFNVLSLVTAPALHSAEKRRFSQVQNAVIVQVVQLADRTRTAYYTAVAAHDALHYAWQVKGAAETSAELAHRMLGAGNWSRLDQFRQQNFYTDALQQLTRAELADDTARTELNRLLDIGDDRPPARLAEHLPELPQNFSELPDLEQTAMQNRIDLKIMRARLDEVARRLKLTQATRFMNVLDVGPTRVREGTQDTYEKGYEVSFEIPLFDSGDARTRKAQAIYAQSAERFAQAAIDARAQIHEAMAQCRSAFEVAQRQHDDILPIAKLITKQDLLRYNASLVSVFDLLADARAQIASVDDSIETQRDYWIARSHLDAALIANTSY